MKPKILIVKADYYCAIATGLQAAAEVTLNMKSIFKVKYKIIEVPGVFEIPVIIAKNINKYDGFITLGCVIKGETPHFDLISKAVVNGIMDLSVKSKKPIGNGIITCLNMKQAIERANPDKKNKGGEAVQAVLATLANFWKCIMKRFKTPEL